MAIAYHLPATTHFLVVTIYHIVAATNNLAANYLAAAAYHVLATTWIDPNLTHRSRDKMTYISRTTYSNAFFGLKYMSFDYYFNEFCS